MDKNMISLEEADYITAIELQRQLYEHIKLLMEKLEISEKEAGRLLDMSEEELFSLRFNTYMVDQIEKNAKSVVEKYTEEHGLKKPE